MSMVRRALAEFVGTAFLGLAVVGSGIAAQRLSPGDVGLQLLENAVATGGALVAIILMVGPVSGAHLNPVVTAVDRFFGGITTGAACAYAAAQTLGAIAGVVIANLTFSLPGVEWSRNHRATGAHFLSEVLATVGLLLVVFGVVRSGRSVLAPFAVGAYITGAYFFMSSTSFANPAITVGRAFTDTFAGIAPASVAPFVVAQVLGGAVGLALILVLYPRARESADAVVVPHAEEIR
ncbi:MAG: MIP/aquaporin family protein [Actinomycetota bacterium]